MKKGAERINQRILSDARSQAELSLAEAEEKAGDIIAAAEKEAALKREQILASAEKEIGEQKRRILGMAQLDARKEMLVAKQTLIEEAFQQALKKLTNLGETAYLDLLRQMLLVSVKTGEEIVILSPQDKAGIPVEFWESLEKELAAKGRAGKISLGPESPVIEGGFILQSAGLEINNSFNALLAMQREELEPEVAAMLFKEG